MVKSLEEITKDRPRILDQLDDLEQEFIRLKIIEQMLKRILFSDMPLTEITEIENFISQGEK